MKKFNYMDPEAIMTVVISLIILSIGVYAFFVVITQADTTITGTLGANTSSAKMTRLAINNSSSTGNSVFNIIGIVLIIGAIMTIVGLVYSYVRPGAY